MHGWAFATRTFQATHGQGGGGETGVDDDFAKRGFDNVGAWILGRNTFGPVRVPWPNEDWRGWWGENPPDHVLVFVLTQYPRADLVMEGDNVFHFVTGGIHEALRLPKLAARDKDVRIGGGVRTVRAYLSEGLIDEMHLAVSPVLLGAGEALFAGLNLPELCYKVSQHTSSDSAAHLVVTRGA